MMTTSTLLAGLLATGQPAPITTSVHASGDSEAGWTLGVVGHPPAFADWKPDTPQGRLQAESQVAVHPDGIDVTWTVTNTGGAAATLQSLPTPPLTLGPEIACMDFHSSGWPEPLNEAGPYTRMQGTWPGSLYSPVAVLMNTKIGIGISVQYPVLDYRHDCELIVQAAGEGRWEVLLRFAGPAQQGDFPLRRPAILPPGASHTYVVTIRAVANPLRWLETLSPYRDWFHRTFGEVAYTSDTSPIRGIILAFSHNQSAENPGGWIAAANRPDLNGYQAVIDLLKGGMRDAPRTVLWAPSGMAWKHRKLNYPFHFTTRWLLGNGPMRTAPSLLAAIPTGPNRQWGLWWGHSILYTPAFDTLPSTPLDINNPQQTQAALDELELAVQSGARLIGLDAFSTTFLPVWDLIPWLRQLQHAQPEVTFCTEGLAPDILHRLAPTWLDLYSATPKRFDSTLRIRGRFLLADWLLPGHETWGGMQFERSPDPAVRGGGRANAGAREALVSRVAGFGYAPVVFSNIALRDDSEE
jgi:hypothetical protein